MKVLVIIPAYNEEKSIVNSVKNLKEHNKDVDYIVINDGSKDNTKKVCIENDINIINLPTNLGIGGAVQTGYKYALKNNYDVAIQYDGDGQHNPKYITKMIDEITKGNDIVIGSRYIEELSNFKSTFMRRFGIKILHFVIKLTTLKNIYDPTSGYRAVNSKIIKLFAQDYPIDYPEPESIVKVIKLGYKVSEIPVEMNERKNGTSSIKFFDSIYYMIKVSLAIIITSLCTRKGACK